MLRTEDIYPSRIEVRPQLLPRLDAVIHGARDRPGCPLSAEQLEDYDRDGFLILPDLFGEEEVARFRSELDRLRHDPAVAAREEAREGVIVEPGSGDVRSIFEIHKISPVFEALARDPRLAGVASFLLDDEVYVHQSRLNYKPGFRGKEFYWHSDFETWHVEDGMPRMRALSISVTLTDNNEFNGPLMLIPGSHRSYVACVGETPDEHYKQSLKKQEYGVPDDGVLSRMVAEAGIVPAKGKAGSAVIFDCNVMHGSNGSITPYPRSNAFFVFNALSNRTVAPFGADKPRPAFLSEQNPVPLTVPKQGN